MSTRLRYVTVSAVSLLCVLLNAQEKGLTGQWDLVPQNSSNIALYNDLSISIEHHGTEYTITHTWGGRRSFTDVFNVRADGKRRMVPVRDRIWPTNVFMGVSMDSLSSRSVSARDGKNGQVLALNMSYPVLVSQGRKNITAEYRYRYDPGEDILHFSIERESRSNNPVRYVLKRRGSRNAWYMDFPAGDWFIGHGLPEKAMLISLQGAANAGSPRLYFRYPEDYEFTYTRDVFDFYQERKYYTFKKLKSAESALETLSKHVNGYVVWDTQERTSLIVAFTLAGLERAIVVTEEQIPLADGLGLTMIGDFRGRFSGWTDARIYEWAYNRYWDRCSRDMIVWLGGPHGTQVKPGVADWGMYNKVFFNDLSSRPSDSEEYELARKILGEMNPASLVMGWHSYGKDKERDHVSLVSGFGHRVEGLHTLPNMSFSHQVPASPGFEYKNNHTIEPGAEYIPEHKVYISCVQTDGLGIGAWLEPGRGEIPYAWEVIMNYSWLAPAMMEFFYSTATPNDYFIGALSGPGYMYPKAVPPEKLPRLIQEAGTMMKKLDLNVFEIMDYSQGATVEGNTELTKEVVDQYYENMPNAIGFLNGYAPAFTFTERNGRPLISFDYYLSPQRTVRAAVADLHELAAINDSRPYFLLMHVREYSSVQRVKNILNSLGEEFELVPLDRFLKMAGSEPTFKERYLDGDR